MFLSRFFRQFYFAVGLGFSFWGACSCSAGNKAIVTNQYVNGKRCAIEVTPAGWSIIDLARIKVAIKHWHAYRKRRQIGIGASIFGRMADAASFRATLKRMQILTSAFGRKQVVYYVNDAYSSVKNGNKVKLPITKRAVRKMNKEEQAAHLAKVVATVQANLKKA